jgi:hypothetical protein
MNKTLRSMVLAVMLVAVASVSVRPVQWSSNFTEHEYGAPATFLIADGPEEVPPTAALVADGPEEVPPTAVLVADGPEEVPPTAALVADGPEEVPPFISGIFRT